jgi:hypothetical protein
MLKSNKLLKIALQLDARIYRAKMLETIVTRNQASWVKASGKGTSMKFGAKFISVAG